MLYRLKKKIASRLHIRRLSVKRKDLQYVSDLHLELRDDIYKLEKVSSNLALLGDVGNPFKKNYREFVNYASYNWDNVFLIAGNHEYYSGRTVGETEDKISEITGKYSNICYLNNSSYRLGEYDILGTTLWHNTTEESSNIRIENIRNEYIWKDKRMNYSAIQEIYNNSRRWLVKNIYKDNRKKIVLTHYLPSYKLIHPMYQSDMYNEHYYKYANDLDHIIKYPVTHWLCGHSHSRLGVDINGVFCGINAIGYPSTDPKVCPKGIYMF